MVHIMENLIDLDIEDEEDKFVTQNIKIFEQADAQRNQLIKVRCTHIVFTSSLELIDHCRNYVVKSKT